MSKAEFYCWTYLILYANLSLVKIEDSSLTVYMNVESIFVDVYLLKMILDFTLIVITILSCNLGFKKTVTFSKNYFIFMTTCFTFKVSHKNDFRFSHFVVPLLTEALHIDVFCRYSVRWIRYSHFSVMIRQKTTKFHLCALCVCSLFIGKVDSKLYRVYQKKLLNSFRALGIIANINR